MRPTAACASRSLRLSRPPTKATGISSRQRRSGPPRRQHRRVPGAGTSAAAPLTAVLALGATGVMVRGGAFNRRVVVELREDLRTGGQSAFAVTAVGRPAEADVRLEYPADEQRCRAAAAEIPAFGALRRATFQLATGPARELKVWAHRVTPGGASEGLPALLELQGDGETRRSGL